MEPNEIQDSKIIDATEIVGNDSGRIQFKIKLPSGREVTSEWMQSSDKTKALTPWLEAIRANIMADAAEERARQRRATLAERETAGVRHLTLAEQERNAPADTGLILPLGYERAPSAEPKPSVPIVAVSAPSITTSAAPRSESTTALGAPDAFVNQGIQQAQKDVEYWRGVAEGAMSKWNEAQAALLKWQSIKAAMSGGVESNVQASVSVSGTDVPGRVRRGRPKGSRNRPKPDGSSAVSTGDSGGYPAAAE